MSDDMFYARVCQERDQLRAELEKLRCELDDAEERASEAEERCAAEWEKDCGQALRLLAQVTKFEWDQDGSPADEVREHIQITIESLEKQVVALRAELARLQRNEDCVQRLIVWAAENGWNGVDNAKILDSFIIGLFDQLRAELAAAKEEQIATLAELQSFREHTTALAADNARLRKALEEQECRCRYSILDLRKMSDWGLRAKCERCAALSATPAQSLAAHDAALLREVAVEIDALAAGPDIDTIPTRLEDIANAIRAKADRIERGQNAK